MVIDRYLKNGILFKDEIDPRKKEIVLGAGNRLLYSPVLGGVDNQLINPTAVRVNNATLDGWIIDGLPSSFAIGKPGAGVFSGLDGAVAFGGRRGADLFTFRLEEVGWLHWTTKIFTQLGGAPTYDRANLSRSISKSFFGSVEVDLATNVTWGGIWTAPLGGAVGIRWDIDARRMKEEITINQPARDWLADNPAATPNDETYFAALFQIDQVAGRKIRKGSEIIDIDNSIELDDSDGQGFELLNGLSEFFGFMPISDAWVNDPTGAEIEGSRLKLRKRIFRRAGKTWLAIGIRADHLAAMPAGDLILDPTIDDSVAGGGDDGSETRAGNMALTANNGEARDNASFHQKLLATFWDGIAIAAGSTIDTSSVELYSHATSDPIDCDVYFEAADDAAVLTTTGSDISNRTTTTGIPWNGTATAGFEATDSMVSDLQEVIDRGGWATGQAILFILIATNGTSTPYRVRFYDNDASYAAKFKATFTEAAGDVLPRGLSPIGYGVVASGGGSYSGLHPIEEGYI